MPAGRPPVPIADHLAAIDAPQDAKERARVVLEVLAGQMTVADGCVRLGVSETRLHEMRRQALDGAVAALVPGRAGRPGKREDPFAARERELLEQIRELKIDRQAALVRTELALTMPHVLRKSLKGFKKKR